LRGNREAHQIVCVSYITEVEDSDCTGSGSHWPNVTLALKFAPKVVANRNETVVIDLTALADKYSTIVISSPRTLALTCEDLAFRRDWEGALVAL
jgi:hypothetical protein